MRKFKDSSWVAVTLTVFAIQLVNAADGGSTSSSAKPQDTPSANSATSADQSYFASDNDALDGDHLKLRVTVRGFQPIGSTQSNDTLKCAPKGAVLAIKDERDNIVSVRFKKVPSEGKAGALTIEETPSQSALDECGEDIVNDFTQYEIRKSELIRFDFRRSGITFGALIVPFKFYLGGDKKITSSSTIAPYIGFRGPAPFGLTFTPVFSAGLGLVPVNDGSGQTETKSAFSSAVGLVLTSTKNQRFNAGVLVGRDFLSKADEKSDPNLKKTWLSLYVGYKL